MQYVFATSLSLKKKVERWKLEEAARFRKRGVKGEKGLRRFVG